MKNKILNQARLLYNKNGLQSITARVICDSLGISLGSYSYHFPDKKMILENLYETMLEEIQQVYLSFQDRKPDITTYLDTHKELFLIQEKYKFFYLNLFEILANNPKVKKIFNENRKNDITLSKQMISVYMQQGVLRKDLQESEIDRLINVGLILNNFWALDAEISPKLKQNDRLIHYMKICCGLLEPHLEPSSAKAYHDYFESLEITNS